MTGLRNKWAIALAAGAFTTTLVGGVAFASFQAPSAAQTGVVPPGANSLADQEKPKDKIKATLDDLVKKGTITQAQEDAILQALKDAAPSPRPKTPAAPRVPTVASFLGDQLKATATFLGLSPKELLTQLQAGKSIADVAVSLNKSTTDLAALLTKNANDRIDLAVAAKKLTADQGTALKSKVAAEVTSFLQRSFAKPAPRPFTPLKPTPSPKP